MTEVSRRDALTCMLWAGTGVVWSVAGGIPRAASAATNGDFSFVQISDSHIGFNGPPNMDVPGTLNLAITKLKDVRGPASLLLHTGDVSHLSRPAQFDTADQIIGTSGMDAHFVPGEHDVLEDDGKKFFERFTKAGARGYYSFDQGGVHFIGLNNVQNLKSGGLGLLGVEQLTWLERDLAGRAASQPIVVFAHIPLWTVYAEWGWGTEDAAQALTYLKRFGSVTVLNGHIHQVMQKVEGTVAFHSAMSTAFPQPAPGTASNPGPMKNVAPGQLHSLLGITRVHEVAGKGPLAIIDTPLMG